MIRIFAENANRDIFLGTNNKLSILTGIEAVAQATKSAIEIQQGESDYNVDRGVPMADFVLTGVANLQQFDFFARKQILSVPDVTGIVEFDAVQDGERLEYTAKISTIYGEVATVGGI